MRFHWNVLSLVFLNVTIYTETPKLFAEESSCGCNVEYFADENILGAEVPVPETISNWAALNEQTVHIDLAKKD